MNTGFLLMAKYDALPVIPAKQVCADFFPHLTLPMFFRKIADGQIAIILTRMEDSQKSAKGVHLQDLADYVDARRHAAQAEHNKNHK